MQKEIYLAGGCFWGVQHYFKQIKGITETTTGYANGNIKNPNYQQVYTDTTGFVETVLVKYDNEIITLPSIIRCFFNIIDPTSKNKQGEDRGTRYRTGIYYSDKNDAAVIKEVYANEAAKYSVPLCVEMKQLKNFYAAEEMHQDYLDKNANGYCHLPIQVFAQAKQFEPITSRIKSDLFANQDMIYRDFQAGLMPTIDKQTIIGVRVPILRKLAKSYAKDSDIQDFLLTLPHNYYEENNLHGFIICLNKDFDDCISQLERFLPYVDNWATCDMLRPKIFDKHLNELLVCIKRWLNSKLPYTQRFAIEMLMTFYLDDCFDEAYLQLVAAVENDHYYVKMMRAWFFATALAKQYEATLPYIEQQMLPKWEHNKTIQKACESLRLTKEQKTYLRKFRWE